MVKAKEIKEINQRLGYEFRDTQWLITALTHRSAHLRSDLKHAGNNERFEFLGDSLLNFIISSAVYQQFPEAREGQLSRWRASLVRETTLAEIARHFELGQYILLGPGELKSGGHRRDSILADTLEAIIAAIYQDSDIHTCRATVLNWFAERLSTLTLTQETKDPKTQLQEYLQALKLELPEYKVITIGGEAHDRRFTVQCIVPQLNFEAIATGSSRRRAEVDAASLYLDFLKTHKPRKVRS
jgi:ribonuclease-3